MTQAVSVLGTGSYLPGEPVSNRDLASVFGREVIWVAEMLGAQSRHFALDFETRRLYNGDSNAVMAAKAGRAAIADAEIDPQSIDLLLMATCTPDYAFPATVLFVQELLALPNCCALELRAGCGGMAQTFMIARHMIEAGTATTALLIGSDLTSPLAAVPDQATELGNDMLVSVAMFGDGAGAVVLGPPGPDGDGQILDARSWSMSPMAPAAMLMRNLTSPLRDEDDHGGAAAQAAVPTQPRALFQYDSRSVLENSPRLINAAFRWLREDRGYDLAEIDYFLPPQGPLSVDGKITSSVAAQEGLDGVKVMSNFARVANTVSASIYVLLDELRRDGTLGPGDQLVLLPAEATKWVCGAIGLRWGLSRASV